MSEEFKESIQIISDWRDKYIDFQKLNTFLKKANKILKEKDMYNYAYDKKNLFTIVIKERIRNLEESFFQTFYDEFDKFIEAFQTIFEHSICPIFSQIAVAEDFVGTPQFNKFRGTFQNRKFKLKHSLELFYKFICLTQDFLRQNLKIIFILSKKYYNLYQSFGMFDKLRMRKFNEYMTKKYPSIEIKKLNKIQILVNFIYYSK